MKGKRGWITGAVCILLMLFFLEACAYENGGDSAVSAPTSDQESATTVTAAPTTTKETEQTTSTAAPTTAETKPVNYEEVFAYDSSKPMNVKELSIKETKTGVKIREISYDAYDKEKNLDGEISCYLVEPKGKGPFPAVLYFHWLGYNNSNKDEFLDEATALADKGVAGLLIDGYFPWRSPPSELENDKSKVVYQVIEVKRALDYLLGLKNVDPKRVGYVGHDYGALYGAVLSGIEKRIGSYVFIAGMGNFSDWFLQYWNTLSGDKNYFNEMSELDPVNFVKNAAPAKLFFQFAEHDRFISPDDADVFYRAASDPKEEKTYDAQHEMNSEEALKDRQQWLLNNLK